MARPYDVTPDCAPTLPFRNLTLPTDVFRLGRDLKPRSVFSGDDVVGARHGHAHRSLSCPGKSLDEVLALKAFSQRIFLVDERSVTMTLSCL